MVNILKLDDFLNLPKCNFIKVDVELMEIDVLKGGEKLLKKFKEAPREAVTKDVLEMLQSLADKGFVIV